MEMKYIDEKQSHRSGYLVVLWSVLLLCTCIVYTTFAQQAETGGNGVQVHRNIRYGEKPKGIGQDTTSDRTLDLYLPERRQRKLPVVVFVHGGGFAGGDKGSRSTQTFCEKLVSHGFAVISINYYLTLKHEKTAGANCTANMSKGLPKNGFHPKLQEAVRNASHDTQLALQWIKEHTTYGLDPSAVVLCGGSAGAMTVLYTAYASNQHVLPIRAVVNLWGGLENSAYIQKGAAPLLTYHGDQDKLIHVDYAYDLDKKMKETGNTLSETHVFEGKGHAIYNFITANKTEEIVGFLKKALAETQHIGVIQGINITKEELQREMRKHRAEVYRLVMQKNGTKKLVGAFWQTSLVEGERALDILRKKAVRSLTVIKVQEKMLVERNLWPYTNYQEFLTDLKNTNDKRENAVKDNQVVYGPVTFDEQTFFDYRFTNALIQLKHKLVAEQIITVTQRNLEDKFKELQQTVYKKEKETLKDFTRQVTEAYVEEAYAALVAERADQAETDFDMAQLSQVTLNN